MSPKNLWRNAGLTLCSVVLLTGATLLMRTVHSPNTVSMVFPIYLAVVVTMAVLGSRWLAMVSALAAALLENYFFIEPTLSWSIHSPADLTVLFAFLTFAIVATMLMAQLRRRQRDTTSTYQQAQELALASAEVATNGNDPSPLLRAISSTLKCSRATLANEPRTEIWEVGTAGVDDVSLNFLIGDGYHLTLFRHPLTPYEASLVALLCDRLAMAMRERALHKDLIAVEAQRLAETYRTSLLRSVSHDLRTPLAAITANSSSLLAHDVTWTKEQQEGFIRDIDESARRLNRLVDNLLDASRLDAGVVTPALAPHSILDIIANSVGFLDNDSAPIEVSASDEACLVLTDPALLERVLVNILANALRHSPPNESVEIVVSGNEERIDITISDHGVGVEPDDLARISQPFQRLSDNGHGVGVGLAVANGFTLILGGRLHFARTPGGGLSVRINLPAAR